MINIPKGTKDVIPSESYKWHFVENAAREVAEVYDAREIRTPVFEYTELFARSIGDVTDIVTKEMYTFADKGGRSLTLKPEGTAGAVRAFIENSLDQSLPLKTFYFTPVYRYERPQAGRYREHHQFGVEFFGSPYYEFDFEVLSFAHEFLSKVGVKGVTLYLNSIGCENCRPQYNKALREFLTAKSDMLCEDCKVRAKVNPLRALDCKNENCRKILKDAPKISDFLCDDCKAHFEGLKHLLSAANIPFTVDSELVRGLDYYTKTVFEFKSPDGMALLGGGRYDNLVSQLGGKPTPCVGFGCGLERLIEYCDGKGILPEPPRPTVFFAAQCDEARGFCGEQTLKLRASGVSADYDLMKRSLKAQMKYASRRGFLYTVVIGESELSSQTVNVKNMDSGENVAVNVGELVPFFKK